MRELVFVVLTLVCASCGLPSKPHTLAGVWDSSGGGSGVELVIGADGQATWLSEGTGGRESGSTRAVLRDDTCTLDEPIEENGGGQSVSEYRCYYVDGRDYLVPAYLGDVVAEFDAPFGGLFWFGLRRRLGRPELERRFSKSTSMDNRFALLEEWGAWPIDQDAVRKLERLAVAEPSYQIRALARDHLWNAAHNERSAVADATTRTAAAAALSRLGDE